ncbi:hypothetical protein BC828DRAFT_374379 [Blastocladiella britannica]|nr:hypothetical protein BC828DRAFT_374379 [Blastocladiella britannica]
METARPPSAPKPSIQSPRTVAAAATTTTSPTSRTSPSKKGDNAIRDSLEKLKKGGKAAMPPIFQSQTMAPAPGQTYYQVCVEETRVLLRDWPKLRYSQAMAHQIASPGQVSVSLEEYADDGIKDKILEVFGAEIEHQISEHVNQLLARNRDSSGSVGQAP